jgi:hypothetical protein
VHRGILHATLALDQISHPPGGPQTGAVPQGLRAPLQALHDALAVGGGELRWPTGTRRTLQRSRSVLLQLPSPAVDRLAMHSHPAGYFGFRNTPIEQLGCLQAPLLEFHSITFYSGWMSHTGEYSGNSHRCHYIM